MYSIILYIILYYQTKKVQFSEMRMRMSNILHCFYEYFYDEYNRLKVTLSKYLRPTFPKP